MPDVLHTLRLARALLEKGWTQHAAARDAHGWLLSTDSDAFPTEAVCFCLTGAVAAALKQQGLERASESWHYHKDQVYAVLGTPFDVMDYNDEPGRTQADVLLWLQQHIDRVARAQRADYIAGAAP